MIYIEKGERVALPSKFRKINNVCAALNDLLTEILAAELYQSLQITPITFRDGEQEHVTTLQNEQHVLDFLNEKRYYKEMQ